MKCHECDSEVADNDVFCPYCGISLQSAAAPSAVAEPPPAKDPVNSAEFESTILISRSDISILDEPPVLNYSSEKEKTERSDEASSDEPSSDEEFAVDTPSSTPVEEIGGERGDQGETPAADEEDLDIHASVPPTPSILSETSREQEIIEDLPETRHSNAVEAVDADDSANRSNAAAEAPEPVAEAPFIPEERTSVENSPADLGDLFIPPAKDEEPVPADELAEDLRSEDVPETISPVKENDDLFIPASEGPADEAVEPEPTSENLAEAPETFENPAENLTEEPETLEEPAENLTEVPETFENPSENLAEAPETLEEPSENLAEAPETLEEPAENLAEAPETFEEPSEDAEAEKTEATEQVPADPVSIAEPVAEPAAADEIDGGITMPPGELEMEEPEKAPTAFDSVRIMEGKDPVAVAESLLRGTSSPVGEEVPAVSNVPAGTEDIPKTATTGPDSSTGDTDGKKGSKLKPLAEGVVLNGRYEIIRKIGGGGMGAVYLASDNNLGGVLRAVKEMVQSHIEEEQQEKAVNDFRRESMILSTLDHVSIPTIFDYFYDEKESRFYLVMKYISGGDLSSRLRSAPEGRIDERKVTEWATQIIDVLDYLHNQPSTIVYRDLKPSNIMIDGNSGRVMLIDFGIARSINQKSEKGVTAVGTMGYAPPELFSGNVEPRSDIYSLGSTMFHLLTGADPQSNPLLIFDFQKNPRPRQINPQLSDQMERILMRAVEYQSEARFASAAEMRSVLEEHLENLKQGKVTYGVSEAPASVSLANQNVFCGFCGQRIVATDLFCAYCGAKQPIAQHGVHSEIYSEPTVTARLVIEGTSELPPPVFSLLKGENLVGRRDPMSNIFPEVDLSKYDPQTKISRRHAKIWRDGGNFLVEDLGSSNGTILAPSKGDAMRLVPNRPHPLTSGDVIKVGDANLHFLKDQ